MAPVNTKRFFSKAITLFSLYRPFSRIYSIIVRYAFDHFGSKSIIGFPGLLVNIHKARIGHHVSIGSHSWLNIGENHLSTDAHLLSIGDNTRIGQRVQINAFNCVLIEEDVLIANNCLITDCDHSFNDLTQSIMNQPIISEGPVIIRRGAWIGINSCIMPDVSIGRNSVVAANSVVLKDVPDYSVVAGVPAKIIKSLNQINVQ
jgi:acetyltransferase-like isoleucine patch superfamily enzyme